MENQEAGRSNSEKAATESLGILANGAVPNAGLYDQPPQIRQPGQFPQLISNEHVQLPPTAQFGMGHHFVPQFPTYMHAVPTGMYSLNMMEDQGDNSGKRRRRTNYRDPENAAKLTTALGILIKQKEENKPQDLKSIASHFGLPYNTLRDNYLKVTTGRLLKDRGEKRPVMKTEAEEAPGSASKIAKKASVPQQPGSNNSSANNTPRESSAGGAGASSSAPPHTQPMPGYGSGLSVSGALPGQGQGPNGQLHQHHHQQAQQFSPYPVFHPQMGMHFMPQMQAQLQHMNMQMANGGVGGVMQGGPMNTMHHPMLAGPPQMMHMFAPAPLGYQINPANGRPFPVYATGGPSPQGSAVGGAGGAGVGGDMQAQMQGQLMNPGMLSMTLPAPIAIPNNNPSNNTTTNNNTNGNTNTEGDTSPTTSNTSSNPTSNANSNTSGTLPSHPHAGQPVHMVPAMGMGLGMPGMYLPMQGPPGPMFAPPMYAHSGVQGGAAGSGGGFPMYANAHLFHPSMGMNQVQGAGNNSNNNQAHLALDGTNTNHTINTIDTNNTNNISSATAAVVTPSANSASYLAAAMTAAYPEVSAGAIGSAGAGAGGNGRSVNGSGAAPAAVAVNTTTNSSNSTTTTTTASVANSATTEEDKKETEAEAERAAQSAEAKADIGKGGDGKKDRDSAAATTTTKTVTASAGGSAAAAVGKRK